MTPSHREYISFAIQCHAQANQTKDSVDKESWEALARLWSKLALPDKEGDL
jgi:hypothetical protein